MKILAVGDLHGDLSQAKKLADQAHKENVDLVILSGDFTLNDFHTEGLITVFKDKNHKIALIPGNHESPATAEAIAQKYGAINLHGYSAYFDEVGLFGCGSANIGLFQLPEKEISSLLEKSFHKIKSKSKKIMVTHVHPDKTFMSKFSDIVPGSSAVFSAIKKLQPDIAICSHIHEAEGIEEKIGDTRVVSVGRNGKIIEI